MNVTDLDIDGLRLIELTVHGDARGFFVERFRADLFARRGLPTEFVQENHSRSGPGVLRGLHYQTDPAQGKLVGVTRGRIWDVAVDIRADSPTFGRSVSLELNDVNGYVLWIPAGFAHGFCVLGDEPADVLYKVDGIYNPLSEGGIRWDDPEIGVDWPLADPLVSERDRRLPTFAEYRSNPFTWPAVSI